MRSLARFRRMATLVPALLLVGTGCTNRGAAPVEMPPPVVRVALPKQRVVTEYQIFTARTQASQSVQVMPRVTGYQEAIKFKDGDEVRKDSVLFVIDKRPYKAALDLAEADLSFAKASTAKARAEYDIGLRVQKQDPTAISEQEIAKRKGSWEQAVATIGEANAKLDNAKLNYSWCEVTAPFAGRVNRHFTDDGALIEQNKTVMTNIVDIRPVWAYFDVDEHTQMNIQRLVRAGEIPSARTQPPSPEKIVLLYSNPWTFLAAAWPTAVRVEMALGAQNNYPFAGHIDFVSNQLDPTTGSIRVRAVFPNQDEMIQSGQFGRIRAPVGPEHNALLVDDRAVGTDQGQKYVLVVNDQTVVEYRAVDVGQIFDGLREVKRERTLFETGPDGKETQRKVTALAATDRIIVEGLQRVRPGAKVDPHLIDMETWLMEAAAPKGVPTTGKKPPNNKQ